MTALIHVKQEDVLIIYPDFDNAPYSPSCHTNPRKKN